VGVALIAVVLAPGGHTSFFPQNYHVLGGSDIRQSGWPCIYFFNHVVQHGSLIR